MNARLVFVGPDEIPPLECSAAPELAINPGDRCVVEVGPVLEYGPVVRIETREIEDGLWRRLPRVLRRATLQDQARARENVAYLKIVSDSCRTKIRDLKLSMQIVSVRHSFDRKVVTVSYTAEERLQLRDVIKAIGDQFNVRVDFRQIGVRDAAGIIGGVGACGRRLCCSGWLKHFEAVTVRMAKNQHLSPNPNTISGVCGRLKCCLRYEDMCYTELGGKLPRVGTVVASPEGEGCVIDRKVLTGRVKVRLEDNRICEFDADKLTTLDVTDNRNAHEPAHDQHEENEYEVR